MTMRGCICRNMIKVSELIVVSVLTFAAFSCRRPKSVPDSNRTLLVAVEGSCLYYDELAAVMPLNITPEDSASFADAFVRNWVSEQLFYRNADRNIADTREIDALVENYRKELIVHMYEKKLVEQKLAGEISSYEIQTFYEGNQELFTLEEPLLKGVCIKLPANTPGIATVRKLYMKTDDTSMDELEKYCIRNAVYYEAFYDNWKSLSQIAAVIPHLDKYRESELRSNRSIEVKDDEFVYFLNVTDLVGKGETAPMERVSDEIRRLLRNSQEVSFIERIKGELYDNALEKKRIEFYNK